MDGKSLNIKDDKLNQLKAIMPEAFSEGKVDWEKMRLTLGEDVNINNERYVLNWAGKSDAFHAIQTPTTATLAPTREESINFNETENIFIEGENLEVLKVLQKAYYGKIKMIYIDPPYNTGNDSFVYPDRFAESREEYLKRINDKDEEGYLLKEGMFRKNSKDSGHFHSNWLSMMYSRLFLSKNLLRDDGIIFVSIDDNEINNLRLMMNEIYGEENFITAIMRRSKIGGGSDNDQIAKEADYILLYARDIDNLGEFYLPHTKDDLKRYSEFDEKGKFFWDTYSRSGLASDDIDNDSLYYTVEFPNGSKRSDRWRRSKTRFEEDLQTGEAKFVETKDGWNIHFKQRLNPKGKRPRQILYDSQFGNPQGNKDFQELFGKEFTFSYPKPINLIRHLIYISCWDNKDAIILDFFAGSCTSAQAIFEHNIEFGDNKKFIIIQLQQFVEEDSQARKAGYRTVSDIGKERISRVIEKIKNENPLFAEKGQDLGFKVLKLKHSNFKLWRGDGIENEKELEKQLDLLADPVRPEAIEENMLFELLLKSGYPLTSQVEKCEIGKTHYYLVDGELAIALSHLDENIIKDILEHKPQQMICLDSLFGENDPLKTNTQLQFKDAGITFHSI